MKSGFSGWANRQNIRAVGISLAVLFALFGLCACSQVDEHVADPVRGFSVKISDMNPATEALVAATCGDHELTVGLLQYFYWLDISEYLNEWSGVIAQYGALDVNAPLAEQIRAYDLLTWQEFFLDEALLTYYKYQTLVHASHADPDYTLPDYAQAMIDTLEESLAADAAGLNYLSATQMLQDLFFPTATVQGYREYYQIYIQANAYYDYLRQGIPITDEMIHDYYDDNAADYQASGVMKNDTRMVNLMQILIYPPVAGDGAINSQAWMRAEDEARTVISRYEAGDRTQDAFAALAAEYSQAEAYLENVYPGQFGGEIDNWCFAADRREGDVGLVRSDHGWHIFYLNGFSLWPHWYYAAGVDFLQGQMDAKLDELTLLYPRDVVWENIRLTDLNLPEDHQ